MTKISWAVAATIALTVAAAPPSARSEGQARVPFCDTEQKVEQIIQSQGNFMPEGCRTVTVTKVDSPAGPLCVLDFGQDNSGIVGAIKEAATTTRWWTSCNHLHAP